MRKHRSQGIRALGAIAAAAVTAATLAALPAAAAPTTGQVTKIENLAYGPEGPGNLLDLYLPETKGKAKLPLVIWHSGSAWMSNTTKNSNNSVRVAEEFTARGYAVAAVSIRSSSDARFPAQGHDARAAVRWLRDNAETYNIDPDRFAVMGDSSGGWAASFTATTSDELQLPGEQDVNGTSSAVHVAVPFFPPTDFLSMDQFAEENNLPQGFAYPHDAPGSPEGLLIHCPGEVFPTQLLSIQDCPEETRAADPATYVEGSEIPMWLMHGLEDVLLPYNQSQQLYEATTREGNEARFSLIPSAGHSVWDVIDSPAATTYTTNRGGQERVVESTGPTWDEIEQFLHKNLSRSR